MNLELGPWLTEDRMAFPVVCAVSTMISGLMYHYTQNYVNSNNYYKEVEKKHVKVSPAAVCICFIPMLKVQPTAVVLL